MPTARKESWIAYLLWAACFLGICGAHRFYLGQVTWGVIYLVTLGFCGIGQFIDLFLIPGQTRHRNLVDKALSEDLKNEAIRQATLTIAGIKATQSYEEQSTQRKAKSKEQVILDILENGEWISFGRLCAKSDIAAVEIKKELTKLIELEVIKAGSNDEGVITYRLL